ncbi:MAG: hypothetical protein B6245_15285 [Desulfobacteraceae bacterium 4572_88]|nr:MAG: hypothetical protein B6245_15285 [Desulfobacteraceae bacterium 4572_88]
MFGFCQKRFGIPASQGINPQAESSSSLKAASSRSHIKRGGGRTNLPPFPKGGRGGFLTMKSEK